MVEIGDQCWFQTNLNTTTFANGDAIPLIYDAQDWLDQGNAEEAAYRTIYGDDIQSEQFDRGLLYNWYSVADERGVCPSGFHVSSETDWDVLESFLGSDDADPIRAQEELVRELHSERLQQRWTVGDESTQIVNSKAIITPVVAKLT